MYTNVNLNKLGDIFLKTLVLDRSRPRNGKLSKNKPLKSLTEQNTYLNAILNSNLSKNARTIMLKFLYIYFFSTCTIVTIYLSAKYLFQYHRRVKFFSSLKKELFKIVDRINSIFSEFCFG